MQGYVDARHPLLRLFHQLRRRGFPLGPDDWMALHAVLAQGFGWASRAALRDACRALWAKSCDDQQVLDALFEQIVSEDWLLPELPRPEPAPGFVAPPAHVDPSPPEPTAPIPVPPVIPLVRPQGALPDVHIDARRLSTRPFVLVPQYPLSFRDAAQAWRRLRRPERFGPATELNVDLTVTRRSRSAVVTPPVLVPRRRSTAYINVWVDREGSMSPFHDFVASICRAIGQTARLADSGIFYFHDSPAEGGNTAALARLPRDTLTPSVDAVLRDIAPADTGWLYTDPDLEKPVRLGDVLGQLGSTRALVILSDAGAARGQYDVARVIDALGFAKRLGALGVASVWLNPLPRERWQRTTAAELARHLPMFPLDRDGTYRAVSYLRGQPIALEAPL